MTRVPNAHLLVALLAAFLLAGCVSPMTPEEPELMPLGPDGPPRAARMEGEPEPPAVVEEPQGPRTGAHLLSFSLGPGYWAGLGDVDPSSSGFSPDEFGDFEEWGFAVSFGYEGRVAELETGSLWLGGQFLFASFPNEEDFAVLVLPSGNTIDGDYSAGLFSFTPTIAYRADLANGLEGFVRGGAGYYSISLQESFDGYTDDIDDDSSFGGFVALGLDIRLADQIALRIEDQIHFTDLDAFPDILPAEGTIDDPIHIFQIGLSVRY